MRLFPPLFPSRAPAFTARLQPERPFFAIGDIHGCASLFNRLLIRIRQSARDGEQIVCLGDYIDRGEESAAVLRRLYILNQNAGVICLMGNHEQMLLEFLDDPATHGPVWLRNGGLQTLASFGVRPVGESAPERDWEDARDALRDAIGPDLEQWLHDLPLAWQSGNVAVVHAGADPSRPIDRQRRRHLLWGHADFAKVPRGDDIWVVHGHTIVGQVTATAGRLAIDTGAYATGRLSAVHVTEGDYAVIDT